jgi:hypothetical protein
MAGLQPGHDEHVSIELESPLVAPLIEVAAER